MITALDLYGSGVNANRITKSANGMKFGDRIVVARNALWLANPKLVIS